MRLAEQLQLGGGGLWCRDEQFGHFLWALGALAVSRAAGFLHQESCRFLRPWLCVACSSAQSGDPGIPAAGDKGRRPHDPPEHCTSCCNFQEHTPGRSGRQSYSHDLGAPCLVVPMLAVSSHHLRAQRGIQRGRFMSSASLQRKPPQRPGLDQVRWQSWESHTCAGEAPHPPAAPPCCPALAPRPCCLALTPPCSVCTRSGTSPAPFAPRPVSLSTMPAWDHSVLELGFLQVLECLHL